ncbi:FAD-dependent monooxygenase [Streptomyces sp. NPDC006307]|uniref:FAD-dependent monooxygenase n=1 Tax=Streptomyces sp. NPDC006307 TaxID=3156748 RepID=UPI0033A1BEEB
MDDVPVVVVGAGPVGLLVASDLALTGIRVTLLDKRVHGAEWTRALHLYPRALEMLSRRGLAEELIASGRPLTRGHFAALPVELDFSVLDTPFPFMLNLPQEILERSLERHARALGVTVRRRCEVVSVCQDRAGVDLTVRETVGRHRIRARYVVGCDGSHSLVRAHAGIAFTGPPVRATSLLADVILDRPPPCGTAPSNDGRGVLLLWPLPERLHRVVVIDEHTVGLPAHGTATLAEVRAALRRVCGDDFGVRAPRRLARVCGASYHAECYRAGRVLLAGDAAHALFPAGGQGLNTGLQEAVDLAGALGAHLAGGAPAELLDAYATRRRAAVARVLASTDLQRAVMTDFTVPGTVLKCLLTRLLAVPAANRALATTVAGLLLPSD